MNEHSLSMMRVRMVKLQAENAKLRAELAEAVRIMAATRIILNDLANDDFGEDQNILCSLNKFVSSQRG